MYRLVFRKRETGRGQEQTHLGKTKQGRMRSAQTPLHRLALVGGTATTFQVASAVGWACRFPIKPPKWHRYSALCAWSHHETTADSRNTLPEAKKQGSGVARSLPKQLQGPAGHVSVLRQHQPQAPRGPDSQCCTGSSHQPWKPIRKSVKCRKRQFSAGCVAWY